MIRELKKITVSFICLGLVIFGILMLWGKHYYSVLWLVSCYFSVIFTLGYMKSKIIHSLNKIKEKYINNLEMGDALLSYEEIMLNKYLMGNNIALFRYLDLLLDTYQIEKFIEVYMLNRRRLKNLFGREYLNLLVLKSSSLLRDRTEYEKRLKKYNFR